jgi:hypothetical protein
MSRLTAGIRGSQASRDDMVYRFGTSTVASIRSKLASSLTGMAVWPLAGLYSLGHSGNLR